MSQRLHRTNIAPAGAKALFGALLLVGTGGNRVGRYQRRQGSGAVDRGEVGQALQR